MLDSVWGLLGYQTATSVQNELDEIALMLEKERKIKILRARRLGARSIRLRGRPEDCALVDKTLDELAQMDEREYRQLANAYPHQKAF